MKATTRRVFLSEHRKEHRNPETAVAGYQSGKYREEGCWKWETRSIKKEEQTSVGVNEKMFCILVGTWRKQGISIWICARKICQKARSNSIVVKTDDPLLMHTCASPGKHTNINYIQQHGESSEPFLVLRIQANVADKLRHSSGMNFFSDAR